MTVILDTYALIWWSLDPNKHLYINLTVVKK